MASDSTESRSDSRRRAADASAALNRALSGLQDAKKELESAAKELSMSAELSDRHGVAIDGLVNKVDAMWHEVHDRRQVIA